MSRKSYKVISFEVPNQHAMLDVWHFEVPDASTLGGKMEKELNALSEQGWKVVSVQPLLRGEYGLATYNGQVAGCVGYSLNESLLVFLEKDIPDNES